MSTFEVTPPTPTRLSAPPVVQPARPIEAAAPVALYPAVRVDIGRSDRSGAAVSDDGRSRGDAASDRTNDERRITIDRDTKSVVYQVLDPGTGAVLVQLPDVSVLRSRAYAEAQAERRTADKPVDREA
ncbi:hypothetical protein [Methylobacterium sp. WL6]|uniref:hypothetical protein n=1 Tax=Methylobacterium sp. WL6 TaxID=2603901 RepID=UPI0011C7C860|nr:hypothetical protein [Methylobacterium sp. WL6]TXN70768.1 hypothetical protein FV230_10310 [Methylobacterium sp. WL6]